MHRTRMPAAALILIIANLAGADEPVDLDAVNKIRDEAFHRSEVMDLAWHLSDRLGPRLTGSPQLKAANEWARDTMAGWGLASRLEAFDFDHGWSLQHCSVHMVAPTQQPLEAIPLAWTPGTEGLIRGHAIRVNIESEADFEKYRGTLAGAILLLDEERDPRQIDSEMFRRHDEERLEELEEFDPPSRRGGQEWRKRAMKRHELWLKKAAFYEEEGVLATVEVSSRDNGITRVTSGGTQGRGNRPAGVPSVAVAAENYNRLVRLLEHDIEVELEMEISVTFHPEEGKAYNNVADLRGTDLADEIVLAGAHIDSWHGGTGATDNAGSVAVVMEAVRILKATGLKPRRTIRIGLWSGEEQGYLGSRAYVESHLATRPEPTDPEQLALPEAFRETTWPIMPLPEHGRLSAYFNMDFGAGRIRGIYAQENIAVQPVFEAWLEPLHDLGATTVSTNSVGGTDHVPFDRVGVPAFQFIQDGLDYMSRTHHSNVDTYEHLHEEDLVQASAILATFLWHTANRDEMIPRKPMPQQPKD